MKYADAISYGSVSYPSHSIPKAEKGKDWCMRYAKAAFYDTSYIQPKGVFYMNQGNYEMNRLYALGKQPIGQYQTWSGVDKQTNSTWLNINWTPRPFVAKFRNIAINRLMQQTYGIVATPIDPLAKSKLDEFYARAKAKIAVREMMKQANPELADHPMVRQLPGEASDIEELEMRIDFGEQFNRSKDAELAISLGFYENESYELRRRWFEDLFDYGVAGYKEWLGDDNKPKFRKVRLDCIITNSCRNGNFSDMVHAGEVIDVSLIELATLYDEKGNRVFDDKQLTELASSVAGRWGNPMVLGTPGIYSRPYDRFKVKVLDLAFFTYNDYYYDEWTNQEGNPRFEYRKKPTSKDGKRVYKKKCIQEVYKIKWVVGTEMAYDFGPMQDPKRSLNPKKRAKTELPYRFYAYNFHEMQALSIMDALRTLIDDCQMTLYKIQNFKNRAVPSGWWIDLDALENVALTKGGKDMEPMALLDMFFQTGVLVGRSKDVMGNNVNYKPVIPIDNTSASELAALYQDLVMNMEQIQSTIGLNEITDGSTPNPKTLNAGYENANVSTNNALGGLAAADKYLIEKLANDVMCRTQQGLKKGDIEGYAPALNSNTLQFIKVSPDLSLHDYGIMIEERPTEEQKAVLISQMQQDIANGFLDSSDVFYITNVYNIKQAQQILAYKVKKAKQAAQQNELQKIQLNNQGAAEAAQVASQLKMQELQLEWELKTRYMVVEKELEGQIRMMEIQIKDGMNTKMAEAKVASTVIQAQAKQQQQETQTQNV